MMVCRFQSRPCQTVSKITHHKKNTLPCIYQLQQSYAACAHISFSNPRSQYLGSILLRENTTWEIWKNMGNQHSHIWWEWNNLRLHTLLPPTLWSVSKCWLLLKARQLKGDCGELEWKRKHNNLREMQKKFIHTTSFFGLNAVSLSHTLQTLESEQAYFMH